MDYLKGIICNYKNKGIVVDTNLLILLIVGKFNIAYIEKCSRVKDKQYTINDYRFVNNLLSLFVKIYVTPQVLAEFSNLSFGDIKDRAFLKYFEFVLEIIKGVSEEYISKDIILDIPIFRKFGFADASIFELASKEQLPVITDDMPLHHYLITSGISSINMDHIRATSWLEK